MTVEQAVDINKLKRLVDRWHKKSNDIKIDERDGYHLSDKIEKIVLKKCAKQLQRILEAV